MFRLVFFNLLSHKNKYKNYILLMLISTCTIMLVFNLMLSLDKEINILKNNIDNRKFQILKLSDSFDFNEINNNVHIIDYYFDYDDFQFNFNNYTLGAKYIYYEEYANNIIKGRYLNADDKNMVVLPQKILIDDTYVYLEDLYDKEIDFYISENNSIYKAKVVGIYESSDFNASVLIPKEDFQINLDIKQLDKLNIIIDNYDNLYEVSDKLSNFSDVYFNTTLNNELLEQKLNFFKLFRFIGYFILFILLTIFIVIINNIKYDLKNDFVLLRTLGYSNLYLTGSIFKFILIIFGISYLLSMVINFITTLILKKLNLNLSLNSFINSSFVVLILNLFIIFISCICFYIRMRKQKVLISEL